MAALVVLNSDCSKLSKTAIKKSNPQKLSTITIYQNLKEKNKYYFSVEDWRGVNIFSSQEG